MYVPYCVCTFPAWYKCILKNLLLSCCQSPPWRCNRFHIPVFQSKCFSHWGVSLCVLYGTQIQSLLLKSKKTAASVTFSVLLLFWSFDENVNIKLTDYWILSNFISHSFVIVKKPWVKSLTEKDKAWQSLNHCMPDSSNIQSKDSMNR